VTNKNINTLKNEQTQENHSTDYRSWLAHGLWLLAPLVLFIDEVDGATNHQVFLDFLGMLHQASTGRDTSGTPALRSVILAGVTDVSRLRPKTRLGDQREPGGLWNNAVDCGVDLSFSAKDVASYIGYDALYHDGIAQVEEGLFSSTIAFDGYSTAADGSWDETKPRVP